MITINCQSEKERLDNYLSSYLSLSRSNIAKKIKAGLVLIDDKVITKAGFLTIKGSIIKILDEEKKEIIEKPSERLNLNYVYKDKDIAIINKPRGLVVHPASGHHDDTLVNQLFYNEEDFNFEADDSRPGIVHRLDKDTSGLLAIAMNKNSENYLEKEVHDHLFHREYLALVYGKVTNKRFLVDLPLTRPNHSQHCALVDKYKGREARTHFELLMSKNNFSLLRCRLETGRTHQIRAHLAYIGFPIVGDELYAHRKDEKAKLGQCLHAFSLPLIHPVTEERMKVYAPLDEYFRMLLKYYFSR